MNIPVFMDLEANDQLAELRSHMKSKNIAVKESADNLTVEENLLEVIKASEKLWKEVNNEAELELLFNSIISLNIVLPRDKIEAPTLALCQILGQPSAGNDKKNLTKLKLLNHLFIGLDNSSLKYNVYVSLVQLAGKAELLNHLNLKLEDVKAWTQKWNVSVPKYQALLRMLHEIFVNAKFSDRASKVMLELLGTYSEENAAQAREDARRCIVTCIADPTVLLLDHLLLLKPVKFLEGELIHDLVSIFVTGRLNHYMEFYQKHKEVIESNGLNHEKNIKKMRLLTFLSLAEGSSELSFETIEQELQLQPNQAESFVIEVIRSKAAQARIVQTQKKVVVTNALNRTFGRAQWLQLKEKFSVWQAHLLKAAADVEMAAYERV